MDIDSIILKNREIENIIQYTRGTTGNNFQNNVGIILKEYYRFNSVKYEMPEALGGDYKNDGWVETENLFYMIYSPIASRVSLTTDIKKKFESDLSGILKIIYEENKWSTKLNKVIFIVNMVDRRLPPDPDKYYEKTCQKYMDIYNINFECEIWCMDNFRDVLDYLPYQSLAKINIALGMAKTIDLNVPNAKDISILIGKISSKFHVCSLNNDFKDYKKISTQNKIDINDLNGIEVEINSIIEKMSVVDDALAEMNQDINDSEKFFIVRKIIMDIYKKESVNKTGVELYNSILEEFISIFDGKEAYIIPAKFILVYIFDHCDIFKKEK